LRREKERKITNRINQGQGRTNIPLRGKQVFSSAEENAMPPAMGKSQSVAGAMSLPKSNAQPERAVSLRNSGNVFENSDQSLKISNKDAIREKFNNGLAKMYAEALGYYKNRSYKEARDRFTDIKDIAPDYKRTNVYLGRIEEEILKEQKRHEKVREDRQYNVIQKTAMPRIQKVHPLVPSAVPVNRQDAVSSALDDFEIKFK
jgi:hypothetical protein